jgi:hypothetical protein
MASWKEERIILYTLGNQISKTYSWKKGKVAALYPFVPQSENDTL